MRQIEVNYYVNELRRLFESSPVSQEIFGGVEEVIVRNKKDSLDRAFYNMNLIIEYCEKRDLLCFVRAYIEEGFPKCEVIIY